MESTRNGWVEPTWLKQWIYVVEVSPATLSHSNDATVKFATKNRVQDEEKIDSEINDY
jgi:hypothetical protein